MYENTYFKIEKNFIVIKEELKIKQAIKLIKKASKNVMIFYIYVVDEFNVLRGVLPIKNLLLANENQKVKDIMIREPITISEKLTDEEILEIFNKTKFLALPVVDDAYRLKGVVTYKNAVDAIKSETAEDILKIHGADIKVFDKSLRKRIIIKLPWLITTVISGIFCGWIVNKYQVTLINAVALAFFIPLITAIGESVSTQTSAIIIEGMAINKITSKNIKSILFLQIIENFLISIFITLLVFLMIFFWVKDFLVVKVISITIFIAVIIATFLGIMGPLVLKKIGMDPAAGTNPIILALSDISILIIYFSLALFFFKINFK